MNTDDADGKALREAEAVGDFETRKRDESNATLTQILGHHDLRGGCPVNVWESPQLRSGCQVPTTFRGILFLLF